MMKGNIEIRAAKESKFHSGLNDNGERRSGIDRRSFCYSVCIPERRTGSDRRSGLDRRLDRNWTIWRGRRNMINERVNLNTVRIT